MATLVRVRMAPSPTGPFHVGSVRTALFNYLFARGRGGTFVLRIEDTDQARNTAASLWSTLAGLRWLGLEWDEGPSIRGLSDEDLQPLPNESYNDYLTRLNLSAGSGEHGPYFQSQRLSLYSNAIEELLDKGAAYHCYCSPEELKTRREELEARKGDSRYDGRCRDLTPEREQVLREEGRRPAVRFRMPKEGVTAWDDLVRGQTEFQNSELEDLVLQKSDGFPTYNFAVVIDDALMEITHVLRGEDGISNTPKQILLYQALGKPVPVFAHVPLLLGKDRSKLSKRHGATALLDFRDKGFLPEAMVNALSLLGWSPGEGAEGEVLSMEALVQRFQPEAINKSGAIFDYEKLEWMNGEYLRKLDLDELVELCLPFLATAGCITLPLSSEQRHRARQAVSLAQERMKSLSDVVQQTNFFFSPTDQLSYEDKARDKWLSNQESLKVLADLRDRLASLSSFDHNSLESVVRGLSEEMGVSASKVIHPTRAALSGRTWGPGLFELMELLGRERCLERLDRACAGI
ncbi:MAG: glutamate--tRNA ligase [Armatimonadetes bacterium]|nr:glutamate--tRNA ligase [Armatimonadota bacterium]